MFQAFWAIRPNGYNAAGMNTNQSPGPSRNTEPKKTAPNQEPLERALAIGPSGPAWTLPARASAENFNPFHDELGRFTTGGQAGGQHTSDATSQGLHLGYTGQPTQQNGTGAPKQTQASQGTIASIVGYGFNSSSLNTCVAATIQTMIATKKQTRNVPDEQSIKAQIEAAAKGIFTDPKESIDWSRLGIRAFTAHQAAIVQKVLENNGVQTTAQLRFGSMQALAAAIMASKQPVMISLQREGTTDEHAVTVQWNPNAAGAG